MHISLHLTLMSIGPYIKHGVILEHAFQNGGK